jgi:hypothetical protein
MRSKNYVSTLKMCIKCGNNAKAVDKPFNDSKVATNIIIINYIKKLQYV